MKNLILFLTFMMWLSVVNATTYSMPLSILIDTAYVSNDMHIELEYRVLTPFSKVNLYVLTSMDDPTARQNANLPLSLSGNVGSFKKRIPVNLPKDQIIEILVQLKGDGFVNQEDSNSATFAYDQSYYASNGSLYNYQNNLDHEK